MTTDIASSTQSDSQQQQHQKKDLVTSSSSSTALVPQKDSLNDPNIKFPLEDSWSFWFYKNEKSKSWKENVKFITSVDFVEDFWGYFFVIKLFQTESLILFLNKSVYNHIQLVSKVNIGCDYMFFKVFNSLRSPNRK